MTAADQPPAASRPVVPNSPLRVAARATLLGLGLAASILTLLCVFPVLPSTLWPSCSGGLAVATVTIALGNLLLAASLLDRRPASHTRLTRSLFADLLLHFLVGGGTALTLFLLRTKFLAAASFALAFAASVVVMRITGAAVLARALPPTTARSARGSERDRSHSSLRLA